VARFGVVCFYAEGLALAQRNRMSGWVHQLRLNAKAVGKVGMGGQGGVDQRLQSFSGRLIDNSVGRPQLHRAVHALPHPRFDLHFDMLSQVHGIGQFALVGPQAAGHFVHAEYLINRQVLLHDADNLVVEVAVWLVTGFYQANVRAQALCFGDIGAGLPP